MPKCRCCGCIIPFDEVSSIDNTVCINCEFLCDACNNPGDCIGDCEICGHRFCEDCEGTDEENERTICSDCEKYEI